mgnify:CR=1 FL=1
MQNIEPVSLEKAYALLQGLEPGKELADSARAFFDHYDESHSFASRDLSVVVQLVRTAVLLEVDDFKEDGPLDMANRLLRKIPLKQGTPAAAIRLILEEMVFEHLYLYPDATTVSVEDYLTLVVHIQTLVAE